MVCRVKKSGVGDFVSAAVDLTGKDITTYLTSRSQDKFQNQDFSIAIASAYIVVYPDITTSDVVAIISPTFFLDSSGKGRLEKFGFGAETATFETFTAVSDGATTGAEIFLAFEYQIIFSGQFQSLIALVPATDFAVEKGSLPTAHGILDTIC